MPSLDFEQEKNNFREYYDRNLDLLNDPFPLNWDLTVSGPTASTSGGWGGI